MTPKEMHIGLDLLLQKVNSSVVSSLKPEQKDWLLNEEVLRFIKQRVSPLSNDKKIGFEDNQKRYDDLRALITSRTLTVYTNDSDSVFSYLPSDYFSLINDRSLTKDLCGVSYTTVPTSAETFYIAAIPIADDNTNLYSTFRVDLNTTNIFDLANYTSNGLPSSSSKFVIVNYLLQKISELSPFFLGGISAKYEYYYNTFSAGSIIVVAKQPFTFTVTYAGSTTTGSASASILAKVNHISGVEEVPNRLSRTEDVFNLLSTSFGTTIAQSPISLLEGGKIIAYHKQKFILSNLNISYIRKPKKIDINLNQGCELSEATHTEIVDNTAKRLAALIGSGQYQGIINENLLKE